MFVDDDPPVIGDCAAMIGQRGYDVVRVIASAAPALLQRDAFDLVVLDAHPPQTASFEACRRIREISDLPLVFVVEGGTSEDRLFAFDLGADDYIQRPFSIEEIERRLRAILRRQQRQPAAVTLEGPRGLTMRVTAHEAHVGTHPLALTPREFDLLRLLLERRGQVLSTDAISEAVWGYETFGSRNFVEAHISRLRAKLARTGAAGVVATVRGVGYIIR